MDSELNLLFERLELMGAAIFSKDLGGRYISINDAGCTVARLPVQKILGQTDAIIFDATSADLVMQRDREIIAKNKIKTYSSLARQAGEWLLFRSAKMVLHSSHDQPAGLLGISFTLNRTTAANERNKRDLVDCAFERMQNHPRQFQRAFLQRQLLSGQRFLAN